MGGDRPGMLEGYGIPGLPTSPVIGGLAGEKVSAATTSGLTIPAPWFGSFRMEKAAAGAHREIRY